LPSAVGSATKKSIDLVDAGATPDDVRAVVADEGRQDDDPLTYQEGLCRFSA
jgi:hypothetical protein